MEEKFTFGLSSRVMVHSPEGEILLVSEYQGDNMVCYHREFQDIQLLSETIGGRDHYVYHVFFSMS